MTTCVAVILAAGVGSRLRPLTADRPKALVPVGGRTILSRAMEALVGVGVSKVVVATGYREDALRAALAGAPVEIVFCPNPRYDQTQNSVSLALCRDALEGAAFFRLDGDVVFDPAVLSRLDSTAGQITAAIDRARVLDDEAMKVRLDPAGTRILSFGKGIPLRDSGGESIGIERISEEAGPLLFDALDRAGSAGETHLYYEDVYARLITGGLHAAVADVTGLSWCEIDAPEDLAEADRLFPG
jgi:choline kinase